MFHTKRTERRINKDNPAIYNVLWGEWQYRDPKNTALACKERRTGLDRRWKEEADAKR